jgi:hypothetical protein
MIKGQKDYVTQKQGLILTYQGFFDLKKLYNSSKDWFIKNNYFLTEKEYKEKPTQYGSEFNIMLDAERKIDDYTSFNINVHFLILNVKKSEEKFKGKMHANISAYVLLDRKNKWQTNSIKSFLFFFYNNLLIKHKIVNVYEDRLYSELLDFINNLKKYVNLK